MFQSTEVLDRAYSSITVNEVASQQAHLTKEEQNNLEKSWTNTTPSLMANWDGIHKKIKLDILTDATPIRKRPYPMPYRQDHAFKKKMEEMLDDDGVLRRKHGGSE